jgi:chorismate mutase-like protein
MNTYQTSLWYFGLILFIGYLIESNAEPKPNYRPIEIIILDRLNLMPEVAKIKWNKKLPIEDLERERTLIRTLIEDVPMQHQSNIKKTIRAQIHASKIIQKELFELWSSEGYEYFEITRNLEKDLRPKITSLTNELIATSLYHCKSDHSSLPELRKLMVRPFQIAYEGINCITKEK